MSDTTNEIALEVCRLCAATLGRPIELVTPQARLVEDLGFDSLTSVQLAITLEEKFLISIPDSEVQVLRSVHELVVYVLNRVENDLDRSARAPESAVVWLDEQSVSGKEGTLNSDAAASAPD